MFDLYCEGHGGTTLVSTRSIEAVEQGGGRIELALRCWCGFLLHHVTGRTSSVEPATGSSRVLAVPAAPSAEALSHFGSRLAFETDPADLWHDLSAGEDRILVVDVRSPAAYEEAHVPGAVSIPVAALSPESVGAIVDAHGLEQRSVDLVVVYCWRASCNAATKGAARLASFGIPVKEMIGGIEGWRAEGLPVEGTLRDSEEVPACA